MATEISNTTEALVKGILEGTFISSLQLKEKTDQQIKKHLEELLDVTNKRTVSGIFEALVSNNGDREYHPAYGWCIKFDIKGTLTDDLKCLLAYLFDPRITLGREYHFVQHKNNNRRMYMYVTFNHVN